MKNKRVLKVLATAMLTLTLCVGFAESKTELMGDNYVRFGQMNVGTSQKSLVEVIDGEIYFIADGSNENITEYCSTDDYYIKQLVVDDYRHTIVIGGDISGNIDNGGINELGFANKIEFIGEFERELDDGHTTSEAVYGWPAGVECNPTPPNWFINACNDYGITDVNSL